VVPRGKLALVADDLFASKGELFFVNKQIIMSKEQIQQLGHNHELLFREKATSSAVEKVMEEISKLEHINPPRNKRETRRFRESVSEATTREPLTIYVGSCPDYAHKDGLYTHESLGGGVPLLTNYHLSYDQELINVLETHKVPYRLVIMIADVEAIDDIFAERFTGGDKEEFLARCYSSVDRTREVIQQRNGEFGINGRIISSSFFREFGEDRFMTCQHAYQEVLLERYRNDDSFRQRVKGDIVQRMEMYKKMYVGVIDRMDIQEQEEFLVGRTLRTMAQYLTLGRLISEKSKYPVIINHPTRNIGVYNERNKILLPGDAPQPHPTIPVFEMKFSVY